MVVYIICCTYSVYLKFTTAVHCVQAISSLCQLLLSTSSVGNDDKERATWESIWSVKVYCTSSGSCEEKPVYLQKAVETL